MGWMIRIVTNEALQFLKDSKKLQFVDIHEDTVDVEEEPETDGITADELHQLICELPDGYRTVVNLFVFEDYTHQEIADILGIERNSSASQLYYAKRLLAKRIKELTNKR